MSGHTPRAQGFRGLLSYCEQDSVGKNQGLKCAEIRETSFIGVWCNGSTSGSNPLSVGSNPTAPVMDWKLT